MIQKLRAEAAGVVIGVEGLDRSPPAPQHRLHVRLPNAALDEVGRQGVEVKVVRLPAYRAPSARRQ